MTMRSWAAVSALACGTAAFGVHAQDQPSKQAVQTFRTETDVVLVDVSVRDGARPVTGLAAADFVVTDNGVRQRVESVETTSVPIDLTLVLDLSGNSRGPWAARTPLSKVVSGIDSEVGAITRMLRAEDRIRILAIDRSAQLMSALSPVRSLQLQRVEFDGLAALYDTLAAALLQPVEPARRHVVIARTKGQDSISSIDAAAVRSIAERSDVLFHLVMMETALDNDAALGSFQCQRMGFCWPTRRFWVPFQRRLMGPWPTHDLYPDGLALQAAAQATGGDLHKTVMLSEPTLASTFKKAFEDFRHGYVLRYSPQGVNRSGWHTIDVKVPAARGYTVRARKGYGVADLETPRVPGALPDVPRTLGQLTEAYERDAYRQVLDGIRQNQDPLRLLREFDDAGNPWPASPRREAAFAIELAEAGVFSQKSEAREHAHNLLARFTELVRHPVEADVFERYWHFAVLTVLEGAIRPLVAETFVERALGRFPNEPRFVLSRAIVSDQRRSGFGPKADQAQDQASVGSDVVRQNYEAALALPGVGTEARIRLAGLLHRSGKHDEALEHLTRAGAAPVSDPFMGYLRHLFLGHVLSALDRQNEAVEAYRAALGVVPTAQSARVALMNTLVLRGDRAGAEALAEQVQSETSESQDPWWMYWQGQYRLNALAMARVRELSR